ncbi:MAG: sulfur carrier protein ThiS [Ruminococcus sp.]|nr:sulfur carrier protein ThiS [Ruminococcus sp.]MDE6789228.1 sulfur carrier protein ThiS [Ruminococcus sp.]
MVKINGTLTEADGKSISEILAELGYSDRRVAIELNMEIVPKSEYDGTVLKDGDSVEIVRFVGGG